MPTLLDLILSFLFGFLVRFIQHSMRSHLEVATRVVRYLKGTIGQGILLKAQPTEIFSCWCNSYWAICPKTWRFVIGYIVKFGDFLIS